MNRIDCVMNRIGHVRNRIGLLSVAGLVGLCGAGFQPAHADDRGRDSLRQVDARPADRPESGPTESLAELDAAERLARLELTLARTRLELVAARRGLANRDYREAASRAIAAQRLLASAPDTDVSVYELQVEGILAKAERAGVDVAALQVSASAQVRFLDSPPHAAEGALRESIREDEARRIVEAHAARLAPTSEVAYPADWAEIRARRQNYAGGQIARSNGWVDPEGREWYIAAYDVDDLSYVPPDFVPPFSLTFPEADRAALDREALRQRSQIFNGYAEDLAMGLPLLRYFGGVDDYVPRNVRYSAARRQQIADLVTAFTTRPTTPQVIQVDP